MALFIKFEGVDGECQDKDHKGWVDVLSFSWGLHKAGPERPGRPGAAVWSPWKM